MAVTYASQKGFEYVKKTERLEGRVLLCAQAFDFDSLFVEFPQSPLLEESVSMDEVLFGDVCPNPHFLDNVDPSCAWANTLYVAYDGIANFLTKGSAVNLKNIIRHGSRIGFGFLNVPGMDTISNTIDAIVQIIALNKQIDLNLEAQATLALTTPHDLSFYQAEKIRDISFAYGLWTCAGIVESTLSGLVNLGRWMDQLTHEENRSGDTGLKNQSLSSVSLNHLGGFLNQPDLSRKMTLWGQIILLGTLTRQLNIDWAKYTQQQAMADYFSQQASILSAQNPSLAIICGQIADHQSSSFTLLSALSPLLKDVGIFSVFLSGLQKRGWLHLSPYLPEAALWTLSSTYILASSSFFLHRWIVDHYRADPSFLTEVTHALWSHIQNEWAALPLEHRLCLSLDHTYVQDHTQVVYMLHNSPAAPGHFSLEALCTLQHESFSPRVKAYLLSGLGLV